MKKVKVMLMSVILIAAVGGALAFKARYHQTWCVATPNAQGNCPANAGVGACPLRYDAVTTTNVPNQGSLLCITTKPMGIACSQAQISCPNLRRVINNGD